MCHALLGTKQDTDPILTGSSIEDIEQTIINLTINWLINGCCAKDVKGKITVHKSARNKGPDPV